MTSSCGKKQGFYIQIKTLEQLTGVAMLPMNAKFSFHHGVEYGTGTALVAYTNSSGLMQDPYPLRSWEYPTTQSA